MSQETPQDQHMVSERVAAAGEFDLDAVNALPEFDAAAYLDSPDAIAAYLNEFLDEGDPAMVAHALGTAARARGMSHVAKEAGMARESLYKALRQDSAPRLETVMKVMKAFGVRLVVEPITMEPIATAPVATATVATATVAADPPAAAPGAGAPLTGAPGAPGARPAD